MSTLHEILLSDEKDLSTTKIIKDHLARPLLGRRHGDVLAVNSIARPFV
jgi:hypothetical protein